VAIGLQTLDANWWASDIISMWSGSNITLIAMYDAVTKEYRTYINGVPPSDFTLVPGWAVWIFVDGSGTLTYTS